MKYFLYIFSSLLFTISTSFAQIDLGIENTLIEDSSSTSENVLPSDNNAEKSSITTNLINTFTGDNKDEKEEVITIDGLKEKADAGDVQSQLDLGYMFLYGANGANIDYKQAILYYEMAAKNKNPVALNNMGSLYFNGIGTDIDYAKAIQYFEEAANLGSNDAALNLAIIYLGSDNKNKTVDDLKKIHKLLNQAQKSNYSAKYLLGYSYYTGFLVPQDYIKAFKLIKEAADNFYDEAQYIISEFYISGNGTTKNYNQAVKYLRAAATQGHKEAIVKLADIFAEGKMYTKSITSAHVLYNVAAVMGAEGAAEKRDALEKQLKIEDLLAVQARAENFKPEPSKQTLFIRQTFGNSLKTYIDMNLGNITNIVTDIE